MLLINSAVSIYLFYARPLPPAQPLSRSHFSVRCCRSSATLVMRRRAGRTELEINVKYCAANPVRRINKITFDCNCCAWVRGMSAVAAESERQKR